MTRRDYGQFCGVARALELIGERWALLILRDLILSPKRYTDLRRGLPRIPTNVLATRLKELEAAGVIQRRILPRPEGSVVYELTEYGRELEGIVLQLGRWGAKSLGEPKLGDILNQDSLILALQATFRPESARGLRVSYQLHLGKLVVHAHVDDGELDAAPGALDSADLVIETEAAIKALMAGEISPREAVENGSVRIEGDVALLERFVEVFHIPPGPAVAD
jgi:DNA-binding HxlR family transcriptional regulator